MPRPKLGGIELGEEMSAADRKARANREGASTSVSKENESHSSKKRKRQGAIESTSDQVTPAPTAIGSTSQPQGGLLASDDKAKRRKKKKKTSNIGANGGSGPDDTTRIMSDGQLDCPPASPSKGRRRGKMKTPSDESSVYHQHLEVVLKCMYSLEYSSCAGQECPCVRTEEDARELGSHDARKRVWRCIECIDQEPSCGLCLRDRHRNSPFHSVQRWNGTFFERSSLGAVNLAIHLGHPGGTCPLTPIHETGTVMTVGDVTGIHSIRMFACKCHGDGEDPEPFVEQLLRARFWPATFTSPRTVYTFRLMDHWHLDVMQGKKPVYDYWLSLQRRTKIVAKDLTGYQNFLRAGRNYRDATSRKQSGQGQGIDEFLPPNRYKGSVAVVCPACPEPDFNLPADWKTKIKDPEQRCKFVKILAIDACFKAHLKSKRHDPNDRPLNMGGAYFAHYDEFLAYEEKFKTESEEPEGPCPGVDGMHKAAGGRNTIMSGVVATVCARHSTFTPQGIVNLRKGEKFTHLDLSLKNALGPHPDPELPMIFSSDRACQFLINILERWTEQFADDPILHPILLEILRNVRWAVPKLHIHGHKEDCQFWLHFAYLLCSGRTCGEGVERPWPETNATAMITKDAGLGHREDILNDTHGDWNHKKVLGMAAFLLGKAKDAASNVQRTRTELDVYTASFTDATISEWNNAHPSEEGVRDSSGHVTSRYRAENTKLAKRVEIMKIIAAEETKKGGQWARGRGPTSLLRRLIELEEAQDKLRHKVKATAAADTAGWIAIDKARANLRVQIKLVRALQKQRMPALIDLLTAEEHTSENVTDEDTPEDDPLYLPSTFPQNERVDFGLTTLAETEMKMRRYYAESQLELLKLSIRLYLMHVAGKRKNITGQKSLTRSQAILKKDGQRREKHIRRYMLHYDAMIALGYDTKDKSFQPITEKIVEDAKNVREPEALGGGRKNDAWFWREGKDVSTISRKSEDELNELNEEELRVRYFRLWASWKRWDEEWLIVGAEFDRVVTSFGKYTEIWKKIADRASERLVQAVEGVENRRTRLESRGVPRERQLEPAEYLRPVAVAAGQQAYAFKKAQYYQTLCEEAISKRQEAGALDGGRQWDGWQAHQQLLADERKREQSRREELQ